MTTPEETLAEIKAKRAALAAARDAAEASAAVAEQIERETRALADDEAYAKACDEIGSKKIARVETDLGAVIVRRPNHLFFRRFQDAGDATYETVSALVFPALVHPSRAAFEKMLEEQPAIMARVAAAVCTLAGARLKDLGGKS